MASRASPPPPERDQEDDERDAEEVESALFSDDNYDDSSSASAVVESQILSQLHSNLMDPVAFPRTALSQITERTERTRSLATDTTERYSDYAPSRPPSFLASSPEEPSSPVTPTPAPRFPVVASRLDEITSSSSSSSSHHSRGASEPTRTRTPELPLRQARRGTNVSPVRRLAQFYENKATDVASPASSGFRSLTATSQSTSSPFSTSRSMSSLNTAQQQPSGSSYARYSHLSSAKRNSLLTWE